MECVGLKRGLDAELPGWTPLALRVIAQLGKHPPLLALLRKEDANFRQLLDLAASAVSANLVCCP